jgi:hypothetical protein
MNNEMIKNNALTVLLMLVVVFALTGCATFFAPSSISVQLTSNPSEANVKVLNSANVELWKGITPAVYVFKKGDLGKISGLKNIYEKQGYNTETVNVETKTSLWYWGNFVPIVAGAGMLALYKNTPVYNEQGGISEYTDNFATSTIPGAALITIGAAGAIFDYNKYTVNTPIHRELRRGTGSAIIAQDIDNALNKTVDEVISKIPRDSYIAVLDVVAPTQDMRRYIILGITDRLSRRNFRMVERGQLDTLIREQNFQISGQVSEKTIQDLGKKSGASIVLTGGIEGTGDFRTFTLKVLRVLDGNILATPFEKF